jgi:hypothetical protein
MDPGQHAWPPRGEDGFRDADFEAAAGLQLFFLQGLAQRSDERLDAGEQAVARQGSGGRRGRVLR